MKSKNNHPTPEEEEMWSKLLSPLRIEPTPEADFESRFIEDFHRRLKQESARVSLMSRLVERAKNFIADFSCRRWAAAATTVLVTAFVLGSLMLPDADVPKTFASVGTPGKHTKERKRRQCPGMITVSNGLITRFSVGVVTKPPVHWQS